MKGKGLVQMPKIKTKVVTLEAQIVDDNDAPLQVPMGNGIEHLGAGDALVMLRNGDRHVLRAPLAALLLDTDDDRPKASKAEAAESKGGQQQPAKGG